MKPKKIWDSIMVSLCLVQGNCHNYFVVKKQTGKMCVSDHTWLSAFVGGDVRESQSSPDGVREAPSHRSTSPVIIRNLPGPSTVIGDQGNSGTNPLTGQRQRRRGVSGPPTGRNPLSVPWFVISFLHLEIYDTYSLPKTEETSNYVHNLWRHFCGTVFYFTPFYTKSKS